jgi:hypothetical protein
MSRSCVLKLRIDDRYPTGTILFSAEKRGYHFFIIRFLPRRTQRITKENKNKNFVYLHALGGKKQRNLWQKNLSANLRLVAQRPVRRFPHPTITNRHSTIVNNLICV